MFKFLTSLAILFLIQCHHCEEGNRTLLLRAVVVHVLCRLLHAPPLQLQKTPKAQKSTLASQRGGERLRNHLFVTIFFQYFCALVIFTFLPKRNIGCNPIYYRAHVKGTCFPRIIVAKLLLKTKTKDLRWIQHINCCGQPLSIILTLLFGCFFLQNTLLLLIH